MTSMKDREVWRALELYGIAVSSKGRIRVNGVIQDPLPPAPHHCSRWYHSWKQGTKTINRDAAILMWKTFRDRGTRQLIIEFKDGDISNLDLDNLIAKPRYKEKVVERKSPILTKEQMQARVPMIIEKMVAMWGKKDDEYEDDYCE